MSESTVCAACGRGQEEARLLVPTGQLSLCGDCIRTAEDGLARAIDADMRRRAGPSESVMAEELALNLMDALDAGRADPDAYRWEEPANPTLSAVPDPATEPSSGSELSSGPGAVSDPSTESSSEPALSSGPGAVPEPSAQPSAGLSAAGTPEPEPAPRPIKVAAVIPARYASSRFPGKPLHLLDGKPMIQHVWERCVASEVFQEVLVATDDERILQAVQAFGGTAVMTSAYAKSGTDRVAEIARAREEFTHFVNVQGDEPLIHAEMLAAVAGIFQDPEVEISTLIRPLEEDERQNPNVVKVVLNRSYDALYFSRADIPFLRDEGAGFPHRYAHLGLYGYSRAAVLQLARNAASPLEEAERLEQLRALELGMKIRCLVTLHRSVGVDTPEDAQRVEALLRTTDPVPVPAQAEGGQTSN